MDIYKNEAYNINCTLKEHNELFRELLGVMKKPENPVVRALRIIVLIVSALTIVNIVDKIITWVTGG